MKVPTWCALLALPALALERNHAAIPDHTLNSVKGMLRDMITQRKTAAAKDTTHGAFCERELENSEKKIDRLKTQVEKEHADLNLKKANFEGLKDEIQDGYADLASMAKDNAEHYANMPKSSGDDRASFKAKFSFERKAEALKDAKEAKTKEVQKKDRDVIRRKVDISQQQNDVKAVQKQLDLALDYHEKLQASCGPGRDSHSARQQRREDQISGLKDAYQSMTTGLR